MCMGDFGLGYPLIIDGTPRASALQAKASVGQMQMLNHACPLHANARSANLVSDVTGLCSFYVVSACPILKGKAVLFSYQMELTQTSFWPKFWGLENTPGQPPSGYELRKCLCAESKPCPNGCVWHEKKPLQRTTRPASTLQPPAPPPPAPSTRPPAPISPPAQSHSLPPATSPASPSSTEPTHLLSLLSYNPFPLPHHTPYILHLHRLHHLRPSPLHRPPCPLHQPPQELPPPHTPHTHILTINVGPHCLRAALPALLPEFETRSANVMLTKCHLPLSALAELRRTAHRLLPLFSMFTNRLTKSTGKERQISVITLMHAHLAARS